MPRGSKPGERRGGRKLGVPNKLTAQAKQGIELCFAGIGGQKAFQVWAKEHPSEFYTKVYVKILPLQLQHEGLPNVPLFALPTGSMPSVSKQER